MAIKEKTYAKKFISRTDYEDVSRHGSPDYKPIQTTSNQDKKIREEIEKKFSISLIGDKFHPIYMGFDGKQQYKFSIKDYFPNEIRGSTTKNKQYKTEIEIKKSGVKNKLEELCDLEEFIIKKGFKERN